MAVDLSSDFPFEGLQTPYGVVRVIALPNDLCWVVYLDENEIGRISGRDLVRHGVQLRDVVAQLVRDSRLSVYERLANIEE